MNAKRPRGPLTGRRLTAETLARWRSLAREAGMGRFEVGKRDRAVVVLREHGVAADMTVPTIARLAGYDRTLDRGAEARAALFVGLMNELDALLTAAERGLAT